MRLAISSLLVLVPAVALAVSRPDDTPPTPTETTQTCQDGLVWDEESKTCVAPQDARLDDDTLYEAAREFAYAGRFRHAQAALAAMSDQTEDRVLTYWGFTTRKLGDAEAGMAHYRAALAANPDNLLARSYMGQAFVEDGALAEARAELSEIRARGGRGTWPEVALRLAIESGRGTAY